MSLIQRRVFYGKVGTAEDLVEWAKEMYGLIHEQAPEMNYRVLSDYQSGRTDRVVVEFEMDKFSQLEDALERTMDSQSNQAKFEAAFLRLKELIDHAEVEQWTLH